MYFSPVVCLGDLFLFPRASHSSEINFWGGGFERQAGRAAGIPHKSERILLLSVDLSKDVKYKAEAIV